MKNCCTKIGSCLCDCHMPDFEGWKILGKDDICCLPCHEPELISPVEATHNHCCPKCAPDFYNSTGKHNPNCECHVEAVEGWEERFDKEFKNYYVGPFPKIKEFIAAEIQKSYEQGIKNKGQAVVYSYTEGRWLGRQRTLNAVEAVIPPEHINPYQDFREAETYTEGFNDCRTAILTSLQALRKGE